MSRVVLAMSGGVDSSVAAHLLLEQNHEVIGVFMRHGEEAVEACAVEGKPSPLLPVVGGRADHKQGCCSAVDAADARRVSDLLNIPFYALNLQEEFRQIIDYFVDEYTRGRTPNPCVMCNHQLKFGKLFDYADSVGAEFVATGHYAKMVQGSQGPEIHRGLDKGKDQSYVLFGIQRGYLDRMMLPVGGFHKHQIREIAGGLGFRVADKKDSQEICFVTSGRHDQFVRDRRIRRGDADGTEGEIVTTAGQVVGRHSGIEGFTIGQRKGLGVAFGQPRFVIRIEADTQRVVIGNKEELACKQLTAKETNWLAEPDADRFTCTVKIRYNSPAVGAVAERLADRQLRVTFDKPLSGVAPGQAVVCFDGEKVLGGGWIDASVTVAEFETKAPSIWC